MSVGRAASRPRRSLHIQVIVAASWLLTPSVMNPG